MTVAERILRRVFATVATPLRFRLWDGTVVRVGPGESGFAIVFHSCDVFRRILRSPTPLRFGEAYIAGEIEIEGDILDAMRAADVRLPEAQRGRTAEEVPEDVPRPEDYFEARIAGGPDAHGRPVPEPEDERRVEPAEHPAEEPTCPVGRRGRHGSGCSLVAVLRKAPSNAVLPGLSCPR